MMIFVALDGLVHHETKKEVANNFETLAKKLSALGFKTEGALTMHHDGKAILASIRDGMISTTEGREYYDKALKCHDSPFIGYSFSGDYRSLLSVKTILNHFDELIMNHNPHVLTLLYRREKALRDTARLKQPGQQKNITKEEKLIVVEGGILKHYAPYHEVEDKGGKHIRWVHPQENPLFIPEGVNIIGGFKHEQDSDKFTQDYFYAPFRFNDDVDHIAMHDSVIEIGDKAFEHCRNLQTVITSKNLKRIGLNAFNGCESLTYLDLYHGIKSIDESAFHGCINLKKIHFHGSKKELDRVKHVLSNVFDKEVAFLIDNEEVVLLD